MTEELEANTEQGCKVTLTNGAGGFVIQDSACWFNYRDGSSFLDEKVHADLQPGEIISFTSDKPELCVELVILVVNVCTVTTHGKICMRGHDFHQALPGRCLHQCTFALKPAPSGPDSETTGASPQFVLQKVERNP